MNGPYRQDGSEKYLVRAILCLSLLFGAAPSAVAFHPLSDEPAAEKPADPAQAINDCKAKVLQPDLDETGRAVAATELIKAGEHAWLKVRLADAATPDASVLGIVSAYQVQGDLTSLEEILILSRGVEKPPVSKKCAETIQYFLDEPKVHPVIVQRLVAICSSGDTAPCLREASVEALGNSRDLTAVDTLLAVMEKRDNRFLPMAANALHRITLRDFGTDVAGWKSWWEKNRNRSRDRIIEEAALLLKEDYLREVKISLQRDPVRSFDFIGHHMVEVRRLAAEALKAHSGEPDVVAGLDKVLSHLKSGEKDARTVTPLLDVLGAINGSVPGVQETLVSFLNDPETVVAAAAARSLTALKTKDCNGIVGVVQGRLATLKDPASGSSPLKLVLLDLLRSCGSLGAQIDSNLVRAFLDPAHDINVRRKAVSTLGEAGDPTVFENLKNLLVNDPSDVIRFEAAGALVPLGKMQKEGKPVEPLRQNCIEALKAGLGDVKANVRSECVISLGELEAPDLIAILKVHLQTETDAGICRLCLAGFKRFPGVEGIQAISESLAVLRGRGPAREVLDSYRETARKTLRDFCHEKSDLWFAAGEKLFVASDHVLAAWAFEEFIKRTKEGNGQDEKIALARGRRAQAMYTFDLVGALPLLREILDKKSTEPSERELLRLLAEGYLQVRDFGNAAAMYDLYLARIPEAEEAVRVKACHGAWKAHFGARNWARAVELIAGLEQRDANNHDIAFDHARTLVLAGQAEPAEQKLRRLLDGRLEDGNQNLSWTVRCELTNVLVAKNDYAGALSVIQPAEAPDAQVVDEAVLKKVEALRDQVRKAVHEEKKTTQPVKTEPAAPEKPPEKKDGSEEQKAQKPQPEKEPAGKDPKNAVKNEEKPAGKG